MRSSTLERGDRKEQNGIVIADQMELDPNPTNGKWKMENEVLENGEWTNPHPLPLKD